MIVEEKKQFNVFELLHFQILPIVKRSWKLLYIPLLLAILGFYFKYSKEKQIPTIYKSKLTYMLEDEISGDGSKSSGNSQLLIALSGVAPQSNKNVMIDLSMSNKLIELTLLREVNIADKNWVLCNYYIEKFGYREMWKGSEKKLAELSYQSNYQIGTDPVKDYWLRFFSNLLKLDMSSKLMESGLIVMSFSSSDELFTKVFSESHFNTISDFYIVRKAERSRSLANLARRKRDSLLMVLQGKTYGAAQISDNSFGSVMKRAHVAEVQLNRDMTIVQAQYGEAVTAFNAAALDLERKKPFITVVDDIRLPLDAVKPNPLKKGITFGLIGLVLGLALIIGGIFGLDFLKVQKAEFKNKHLEKN